MGAAANITAAQEGTLSAEQKKKLKDFREGGDSGISVLSSGAKGGGIVKGGFTGVSAVPNASPGWTVEGKPGSISSRVSGVDAGPNLVEANVVDKGAEAQARLAQSRADAAAEDERTARANRQQKLAAGASASRRRGTILTNPLGEIGTMAASIQKTLLGQ